jgi:D-glycero-D-manno-heptose 1,7-bisphosphate phosphatase
MQPADTTPKRALFLDRDGVINVDIGYLNRTKDCRFVDGIFELAFAYAARGFLIIIATNQAGIGRGHYGEAELAVLMDWMRSEFSSRRVGIADVYHCSDHPTAGVGR